VLGFFRASMDWSGQLLVACSMISGEDGAMRRGWMRVLVWGVVVLSAVAARGQGARPVKIVLVGDSTVNAEGGWGKGFCAIMTPNVTCVNDALNGRSTKSFIDEGAWAKALAEKGDYYLFQFGHNDQKPDEARHTDPETTYAAYLRRYIREARAIGAVPVVVTSLSRRTYKDGVLVEDLTAYANAAKRVGAEENVTVIDLNALSTRLLKGMTQAQADEFDATNHEDAKAESAASAKPDRTHLNAKGQMVFGRMVADDLVRTRVELRPDVIGERTKSAVVVQAAPTDGK